jgi:hypothetical protein
VLPDLCVDRIAFFLLHQGPVPQDLNADNALYRLRILIPDCKAKV